MTDPCSTCTTRRAVRGSTLCQRCERLAWHGPVQRFECEACRDSGRIDRGGCDIPGCVHFEFCRCKAGRAALMDVSERYDLPWRNDG